MFHCISSRVNDSEDPKPYIQRTKQIAASRLLFILDFPPFCAENRTSSQSELTFQQVEPPRLPALPLLEAKSDHQPVKGQKRFLMKGALQHQKTLCAIPLTGCLCSLFVLHVKRAKKIPFRGSESPAAQEQGRKNRW
jgi:hypothetical protein